MQSYDAIDKIQEQIWPNIISYETCIECIKKYYTNTDPKFFERIICSVCGQFQLIKNASSYYHKLHPNDLKQFEKILFYENFTEFKAYNINWFSYKQEFSLLNGMVLDPLGFNKLETKVVH